MSESYITNYSVKGLYTYYLKKIILIPPVPAKEKWDFTKKEALIENILNNKPVPAIILKETDTTEITRGQEEIQTIFDYFENELEVFGKRYLDLSQSSQHLFRNYSLTAISLVGCTDEEVKKILTQF